MENKMRTVILSSIMALLVSGCATPAFQPFQVKVEKTTSNMTNSEKQELLNSFIKKNSGTASYKGYRVENSCLEYDYKDSYSDCKYKYCYVVEGDIIDKKDNNLCKTSNINISKLVDHQRYAQQIEKKISTDFVPMKMKNDILKMKNHIANGDNAFNNNDIETASRYYQEACYIEQSLENYEWTACEKKREMSVRKERERQQRQELVRIKHMQYMQQLAEPLRKRKGQYAMTFFDQYNYRAYGYKDLGGKYQHISEKAAAETCQKVCLQQTFNDNGYDNLQEALNDGWKFKSKVKGVKEQINEHCVCEGNSYVLEK